MLQDPHTPVTPFAEEDRYGLNSVPQTSYVGVLAPSSSECGVFGEVLGASLELSPSVESCGCGLGPSPVRLG